MKLWCSYLGFWFIYLTCKHEQSIRFDFLTNSIVRDIQSKDSKFFHINVMGCKNLQIQHVTITAPGDSPNTDGIHIGHSSSIAITYANIGTGGDCISIGDGDLRWMSDVDSIGVGAISGRSYGNMLDLQVLATKNVYVEKFAVLRLNVTDYWICDEIEPYILFMFTS